MWLLLLFCSGQAQTGQDHVDKDSETLESEDKETSESDPLTAMDARISNKCNNLCPTTVLLVCPIG